MGSTTSICSIIIKTVIGNCEFHIVKINTPFLLNLNDMDTKGIFLNNIRNEVIRTNGKSSPVFRKFRHPFIMWRPMVDSLNYLTKTKLRTLDRCFCHPSRVKLIQLLWRAGHSGYNHQKLLEIIGNYYSKCLKNAGSPIWFKFIFCDDVEFNHSIFIDVIFIESSPILHIVDEGTRVTVLK